ncbi:YisL family protein [Nicoliella spurrieriana]|uniref:YisL family protein n=1 Tax=Nicoliella spurrieriana TaxID=2925830 RepID=A0A976RSV3_9LACO|nr:YisL family protein [Nicoliella spurrieriana]UQS87228.1 YisL family protein [Nicoliella spurrieriana]
MILWLHIIFALILIISTVMALSLRSGNQFYVMIDRFCYLVFLVSGIVLFPHAWDRNPILTVAKVVAAIILIGLLEMTFAKQKKHQLNKTWITTLAVLLIIVLLLGVILAGGRPFFK